MQDACTQKAFQPFINPLHSRQKYEPDLPLILNKCTESKFEILKQPSYPTFYHLYNYLIFNVLSKIIITKNA